MATLNALLRAEFAESYENLVNSLPTNAATGPYPRRKLSSIKFAVLHHTAVSRAVTWQAVADYHVNGNEWNRISYHIGIRDADGACKVSLLNEPEARSYHAHTEGNAYGLAVCVAGNFKADKPTVNEVVALRHVAVVLRRWATWTDWLPVLAHGEVKGNDTTCPGGYLKELLPMLNTNVIKDEKLQSAIWAAAKAGQTVAVNSTSAISKFMAAQGYSPIGNETDVRVDGVWQGVAQLGWQFGGDDDGVAFFSTNTGASGEWEVSVVEDKGVS